MRYLHTLDPEDLAEMRTKDGLQFKRRPTAEQELARGMELLKEDENMERYYARK